MDVLTFLDTYAEQITKGSEVRMRSLVSLLGNQLLFTPANESFDVPDSEGKRTVRVVSIEIMGRKVVPTFSERALFDLWNSEDGESHECLEVSGGDLALAMPDDAGLLLNPGHKHEVFFEPQDVRELAVSPDDAESLPDGVEDRVDPERAECLQRLFLDLTLLLQNTKEVAEAYYLDTEASEIEGSLGLFTDALEEDVRFSLMQQLGKLSKEHFGAAGALDIYTDLSQRSSYSWELFSPLTPFYVREPKDETVGQALGQVEVDEQGIEFEVVSAPESSEIAPPDEISVSQFLERKRARLAEMLHPLSEERTGKNK